MRVSKNRRLNKCRSQRIESLHPTQTKPLIEKPHVGLIHPSATLKLKELPCKNSIPASTTADIHWIQLALVLQVLADHLPFKGLPAQLTGKNKKSKNKPGDLSKNKRFALWGSLRKRTYLRPKPTEQNSQPAANEGERVNRVEWTSVRDPVHSSELLSSTNQPTSPGAAPSRQIQRSY